MSALPTLAAWIDEWLALQRTRIEPVSWRTYRQMADAYLLPHLGERTLDTLDVRTLERCYADLLTHGGRDGQPLARKTVALAHLVLHKALADAVRLEVLAANPASRATVPRIDLSTNAAPTGVQAWTPTQIRRFLTLTADHALADLWRVALGTGMRRGELLGLRWQDLALDVPQVTVATALTHVDGRLRLKATKTNRVRTLHLDDDTAAALARQPRRAPNPFPVVFTRPDGSPWRPEVITDRWRRLVRTLDLPRLTLHGLRHSHATALLAAGVPVKVVSERLGHATIAMTMDTYAHVLPAMDRDAAHAYGALLG